MSKIIAKGGHVIDDNDAVKSIDLVKFIVEYSHDVLTKIYGKDIKIDCKGNISDSFIIKLKPLSFIMILDNIIGNAIKAHSTTLDIIIDDSLSNCFRLIFKDNGDGIDKSITDLEHLFDFGYTTTNGSGLGLYYAKKQMRLFNGSIAIIRNTDSGVSVILCWTK